MGLREGSIAKLKAAVRDKTMSCYNANVFAGRYFDYDTGTRCAVGVLIPDAIINDNLTNNGNCVEFVKGKHCYGVYTQLSEVDNYMGISVSELTEMQRLHDNTLVNGIRDTTKLEEFINNLK